MQYLKAQNLTDNTTNQKLKGIFNEIIQTFSRFLSNYRTALANDYSDDINNNCAIDKMEEETKRGFLK